MHQYYVQVIASNYLKNLVDSPEKMKVHGSFLQGLAPDDFVNGFYELHSFVKQLYTDIIKNPAEFEMPLKENSVPDAKNIEYTQSNAGFVRLPNLLFLLGYKGTIDQDLTLRISGSDLKAGIKELKITKSQFLLKKLSDYGFDISVNSKTVKPGDSINIGYPENRYLIAALKSMSDAAALINNDNLKKPKELFYMLNYRILENEKPKVPKLTIEYIYHALNGEIQNTAKQLNDFISPYAKPSIKMGGFMRNDWSCVYNLLSNKRVIMSLSIGQDDLSAKLNLANIGKYIDSVKSHPKELERIINSRWGCSNCHSSCAGPFEFTYQEKHYKKCRGGSFVFNRLRNDMIPFCMKLLEKELECIAISE